MVKIQTVFSFDTGFLVKSLIYGNVVTSELEIEWLKTWTTWYTTHRKNTTSKMRRWHHDGKFWFLAFLAGFGVLWKPRFGRMHHDALYTLYLLKFYGAKIKNILSELVYHCFKYTYFFTKNDKELVIVHETVLRSNNI